MGSKFLKRRVELNKLLLGFEPVPDICAATHWMVRTGSGEETLPEPLKSGLYSLPGPESMSR